MKKNHTDKINNLQRSVRQFYDAKTHIKIYHGSTNSTRALDFDKSKMVDVSNFDEIIEINAAKLYAVVESNVPLDKLVDATLKVGLIPLVVSEFPGITVGGAVQGGAGESSSFKWGCLHETCLEYEVVTASGEVRQATAEHNADLFYGMPCSYGSLAILTTITLRLIPATANVKLEYTRVSSHAAALAMIEAKTKTGLEFIDAIMFAPDKGVVMAGSFTNDAGLPRATFHKPTDEWFYLHAKRVIDSRPIYHEAIPVKDYLFRYDRGAFWLGKQGFSLFHVPFNRFTRLWFASLMQTRTLYRFLHGANISQQFVIQDVCLPLDGVLPFLSYVDEHFGVYPLWLCPLKPDAEHSLAPNHIDTKLVVNVGVWGALRRDYKDFVTENRQLEQAIARSGGRKVLYAHTYYTPPEFWRSYDKKSYDMLRQRYAAAVIFPTIYAKIIVNRRLVPSLAKGFLALLKSPYNLKLPTRR